MRYRAVRGAVAAVARGGLSVLAVTGAGAVTVAARASSAQPLRGLVIGIDPGHNGRNYTDPGVHRPPGLERPGMGGVRHHRN
jgi:N-acetylmuramoyl-L-alanine amidase